MGSQCGKAVRKRVARHLVDVGRTVQEVPDSRMSLRFENLYVIQSLAFCRDARGHVSVPEVADVAIEQALGVTIVDAVDDALVVNVGGHVARAVQEHLADCLEFGPRYGLPSMEGPKTCPRGLEENVEDRSWPTPGLRTSRRVLDVRRTHVHRLSRQ